MNNSEKPVVKENFTPQAEVEVWIARDVEYADGYPEDALYIYAGKPELLMNWQYSPSEGRKIFGKKNYLALPPDLFPSIQPGECKRAKIVLEEEL